MYKFSRYYQDDLIYMHHSCDVTPLDFILPETVRMHAHEVCEIFYFIGGECSYIVEGRRYKLSPGCILLMRPSEVHCLVVDGNSDYERISLHFPFELYKSIDPNGLLAEPFQNRALGESNLYTPGEFKLSAGKLMLRAADALTKDSADEKRLYILSCIPAILGELREAFIRKKTDSGDVPGDKSLLAYINGNLDKDLSLDALGNRFHFSKSQLNRQFKELTGTTIGEYVLTKRLLAARERIQSGESAVATSKDCGFRDYSTFYRAYRKKYGTAPTKR